MLGCVEYGSYVGCWYNDVGPVQPDGGRGVASGVPVKGVGACSVP